MSIENRMLKISTYGHSAEGAVSGAAEGSVAREDLQLRAEGGTGQKEVGIVGRVRES